MIRRSTTYGTIPDATILSGTVEVAAGDLTLVIGDGTTFITTFPGQGGHIYIRNGSTQAIRKVVAVLTDEMLKVETAFAGAFAVGSEYSKPKKSVKSLRISKVSGTPTLNGVALSTTPSELQGYPALEPMYFNANAAEVLIEESL